MCQTRKSPESQIAFPYFLVSRVGGEDSFGNLIGVDKLVVLYPRIDATNKDEGYTLVKIIGFDRDGVMCRDVEKNEGPPMRKDWSTIGLLVPFNDRKRYYKKRPPLRETDLYLGKEVLALWKVKATGAYTTVYYPGRLGHSIEDASQICVTYEGGEFQYLDAHVNVCGYSVPSVIQKLPAYASLPLKEALQRQKRQKAQDAKAEKMRRDAEDWKRRNYENSGSASGHHQASAPDQQQSFPPQAYEIQSRPSSVDNNAPSSSYAPSSSSYTAHQKQSTNNNRMSSSPFHHGGTTRAHPISSSDFNPKPPKKEKYGNFGRHEAMVDDDLRSSLGKRKIQHVAADPNIPQNNFFSNAHFKPESFDDGNPHAPKPPIRRHQRSDFVNKPSKVGPYSMWGDYEIPYPIHPRVQNPLQVWKSKQKLLEEKKELDPDEIKLRTPKDAMEPLQGYKASNGIWRKWESPDMVETIVGKSVKVAPYVLDW